MPDDLTNLMKQLAALEPTVRLGLESQALQIADMHRDVSSLFRAHAELGARVVVLEKWQSEEHGRRSGRGLVWSAVRWGVGIAVTIGAAILGYFAGG